MKSLTKSPLHLVTLSLLALAVGVAYAAQIPITKDETTHAVTETVNFTGAVQYDGGGRYADLWIPAADFVLPAANAPAVAAEGTNVRTSPASFDAATDETAYYTLPIDDAWDLSTVKVRFYWSTTATSGDVVWSVAATAVSDADAVDVAFGAATSVTATADATAGDLDHATTAAVTVAGTPALADLVHFQIYRDADNGSDTCANDAKLLGVRIQYRDGTSAPASW